METEKINVSYYTRVIRRYVDSNIGEALVDEYTAHYENPLKFSGKELDEITGLYDHGARNRNPISTLWYGIDPLWEKYPDYSPYNYCAGNPVKLVDLDGRAAINGYECKYSKQANSETLSNETDYVQAYQIIKMGGYEKDKANHYMGHGVQTGDNNSAFVYAIDYKGNPIKDNKKLHSITVRYFLVDTSEELYEGVSM